MYIEIEKLNFSYLLSITVVNFSSLIHVMDDIVT
jgi:hypothetical protein